MSENTLSTVDADLTVPLVDNSTAHHPKDALDPVDLHHVAHQRARFAKECIDQLLWEIDGDSAELAWAGVSILGDVTERLQSISRR